MGDTSYRNQMEESDGQKCADWCLRFRVGGLTVMREIMRQMPDERIVYFGDTARVPYGNKSKETVIRYSRKIIRFLQTKEVKAIVIACNTASACALEAVEKSLDIPIIGVISAAVPGRPWRPPGMERLESSGPRPRSAPEYIRRR